MRSTTGTAAAILGSALIAAGAAAANGQPPSLTTRDAPSAKTAVLATTQAAARAPRNQPSALTYSHAVTKICAHALLFEGQHQSGTHAGAVAVARDIRASTRRRIGLVAALSTPPKLKAIAGRWRMLELRLADAYASSYVRIYNVIAAVHTPKQRANEPRRLENLVHSPDALRQAAASLEQRLHVPDCTGGG